MAGKRISKLFSRAREAMAPAIDALDAQRDTIARLKEECEAVERARRPRAEAEAAAREQIAQLGRAWTPTFGNMATPGAHIAEASERFKLAVQRDPLAFAAAIAPDRLLALVNASMDDVYAQGDGLPEAERISRLAALRAELHTAELEEESIIRGLEAAGVPAFRRPDARPEIVLADDAELPE